jgi:hypothetical protein
MTSNIAIHQSRHLDVSSMVEGVCGLVMASVSPTEGR